MNRSRHPAFRLKTLVMGTLLCCQTGLAAPESFEYPELVVVPRASERLNLEAPKEADGRHLNLIPLYLSAGMTTVSAFFTLGTGQRDLNGGLNSTAITSAAISGGVGIGWLIGTVILKSSKPYSAGLEDLKRVSGNSQREQLTRERLAEEALAKASSAGWRVTLASVITNFGASVFGAIANQPQSSGQYVAIGSMVTALLPLIVKLQWMDTYQLHQDYKKRIFGPVSLLNAGPMIVYDAGTQSRVPVTGVILGF